MKTIVDSRLGKEGAQRFVEENYNLGTQRHFVQGRGSCAAYTFFELCGDIRALVKKDSETMTIVSVLKRREKLRRREGVSF